MSDIAINQVIAQMRTMAAAAGSETAAPDAASGANFSSLMQDSIEEVNASMMEAKSLATSFESGDPQISVTEVMVASQRAGLEFQAMTEVRNKLLTAYQEIMSMQV
ncbi:flagellar hook-basal body complex protein FliE [Congregibacter litoralis]|uniref:Flagellar hook-basal body complex protein FliE n=1 Tax=Congregibacter litoralis KT71 TaxID=314285 RepID=A4A5Z7_9GAMM|nr:flagellar hook-basal body complex protein FliE [Congregibacter litoralis]EAQ98444.1 flagellar hook-basal body complex protein FliE [Congregibacter litoralis KT71]